MEIVALKDLREFLPYFANLRRQDHLCQEKDRGKWEAAVSQGLELAVSNSHDGKTALQSIRTRGFAKRMQKVEDILPPLLGITPLEYRIVASGDVLDEASSVGGSSGEYSRSKSNKLPTKRDRIKSRSRDGSKLGQADLSSGSATNHSAGKRKGAGERKDAEKKAKKDMISTGNKHSDCGGQGNSGEDSEYLDGTNAETKKRRYWSEAETKCLRKELGLVVNSVWSWRRCPNWDIIATRMQVWL
jgi:hypothetical protein